MSYGAVFHAIDINNDGVLSPEELFGVLACMGLRPTVEELHNVMTQFDVDGDGEISLDEFLGMMRMIKKKQAEKGEELSTMLTSMTDLVTEMYHKQVEAGVIGNSPYILHPKHPTHSAWDLFVSVLLGITMITIPLTLAFEGISKSMLETNVAIDMMFLVSSSVLCSSSTAVSRALPPRRPDGYREELQQWHNRRQWRDCDGSSYHNGALFPDLVSPGPG